MSNNPYRLLPGDPIIGKWHKNNYQIVRELGSGATGTVYLARQQGQEVALKISHDELAIMSEVNVLKKIQKVQGSYLGPSLLDVDDLQVREANHPFYVMEYIKGSDFLSFINSQRDWLAVLILQLLKDLNSLHEADLIFGDLKPDNLIVTSSIPRIRLIDVGGVTEAGRAIKEFTEFYDRGYWGLGSRRAEVSYDLFSVGMIMINSAYPARFPKTADSLDCLRLALQRTTKLAPFESIIMKSLLGKYKSALEMRAEILAILNKEALNKQRKEQRPGQRQKRNLQQKQTRKGGFVGFLSSVTIVVTTILLYFLYIYQNFL